MWVYTSTSPPIREEENGEEPVSTGGVPTLRATPNAASNEEDNSAQCWQCGAELVWPDEQQRGTCWRCGPTTDDVSAEEATR